MRQRSVCCFCVIVLSLVCLTVGQFQPLRCVNDVATNSPQPAHSATVSLGPCGKNAQLPNTTTRYNTSYGDGTSSARYGYTAVLHVFPTGGLFPITITAYNKDTKGHMLTSSSEFRIYDCSKETTNVIQTVAGKAGAHSLLTACIFPLQLATPIMYTWNYGDGSSSSADSSLVVTNHVYKAAGTYTVSVLADDGKTQTTLSAQVTVTGGGGDGDGGDGGSSGGGGGGGDGDGLSGGAIAGIVIGSVSGVSLFVSIVVIAALLAYFAYRKTRSVGDTAYKLMEPK